MDIELKIATEEDLVAVLHFVAEYHALEGIDLLSSAREEAVKPLLAESSDLGRIWLVLYSGEAVGYIALTFGYSIEFSGRDAFIDEFYLLDPMRGKGIGAKALELIKEEVPSMGVRAIHLEVASTNSVAKRLYSKLEFELRDNYHLMSCYLESPKA